MPSVPAPATYAQQTRAPNRADFVELDSPMPALRTAEPAGTPATACPAAALDVLEQNWRNAGASREDENSKDVGPR